MSVVDIVRVLVDHSVGNGGAVRNCRSELVRRDDLERAVDTVCRRIPPKDDTRATQRDSA